ncbi:MAG: PD40 domain-containing protein [Acidobacteria bacterium]|nr:PD40 domain-containing protein [Acidobacteriota bacterium]
MRPIKASVLHAAIVLAIGVTLAAAVLARRAWRGHERRDRPASDDVVLAEGCDLATTADARQQEKIRALLEAGRKAGEAADLTIDYPHDESIFPPDMIAPTFLWHDPSGKADRWLVDVAFGEGRSHVYVLVRGEKPPDGAIDPRCVSERNEVYRPTPYQASAIAWRPAARVWEAVQKYSLARPAVVTFLGYRDGDSGRVLSRGRLTITTAPDPVGAPIFYRDVPLMPSQTEEGVIKPLDKGALPLINWRLRDISRPESRVLLGDMPSCANCHSFSADGRTMGLDIDGPQGDKGAYAIVPVGKRVEIRDEHVMTWNAFKEMPKGLNTLGFLSRVSPDGRHVISTVNEALYVRNFWNYKFNQVFYPTRGILACHSRSTGEIRALPGADDPEYVHCDPVWTPDGRTIVFARARARDPYIKGRPDATYAGDPNETPIQYDLYRIPFDDGRGGRPEPIAGASNNGMSNSFPKVSPDGRWIVYVQSRNGQLMRPDGRLWIVPLAGGEARLMRCNTPLMNSWHSFSPNGRWMVFSSKSNTPYTQMFLTHIDASGRDSPALLIENSTAANRAVNIPEFVNVPYEGFTAITVPAVEPTRHFNLGIELASKGRYREAVVEYEKALEGESLQWRSNAWRIHDYLSKSLLLLGQKQRAVVHIRKSLKLNPYNAEMHANYGYILSKEDDLGRAMEHTDIAIRLLPKDPKPRYNRATIHLKRGDRAAALADYAEAIRLDPTYADAYLGRGLILRDHGDLTGALKDFVMALKVAPPDWSHGAEVEGLVRRIRAPSSDGPQAPGDAS